MLLLNRDKFKKDTLTIIEYTPERLAEIKGISKKKAEQILSAVEDKPVLNEKIFDIVTVAKEQNSNIVSLLQSKIQIEVIEI